MLIVCASADVAVAGRWVVNQHGDCVHEWTPSSLAQGPLAIANALTFPVRQLVGGGQAAAEDPARSAGEKVLLVPVMSALGLGTGLAACLVVTGQGLIDLVTGGALDIVSDESASPSLAPITPPFLAAPKPAPTTDPCGRQR
jgi:hypothetical protein